MDMIHRYAVIGLAIALAIVVQFLKDPGLFHVCFPHTNSGGTTCIAPYGQFGDILLPLVVAFSAFAFLTLLTTYPTFRRWIKFSAWYAIAAGLLLLAIPEVKFGYGYYNVPLIDTEGFSVLYAALFGLVSLILISLSELKERRKPKW